MSTAALSDMATVPLTEKASRAAISKNRDDLRSKASSEESGLLTITAVAPPNVTSPDGETGTTISNVDWTLSSLFPTLLTYSQLTVIPLPDRLTAMTDNWKRITANSKVLDTITHGASPPFPRSLSRIHIQSRTLPPEHRDWAQMEIAELLQNGSITEATEADLECSSPVFVLSQGEKRRMIWDMRALNRQCHPPPHMKYEGLAAMTTQLARPSWFATTLDISSAFRHVRVRQNWKPLLGFNLMGRSYVTNVLPFGFSWSPCLWASIISTAMKFLRSHFGIRLQTYVDDVCIYARTEEECRLHRQLVVQTLTSLGITVNPLKGQEPSQRVEFLGLTIDMSSDVCRFTATQKALAKLRAKAALVLSLSARNRGRAPVREVAKLTGLANSLSLAIHASRLHSRSLHNDMQAMSSWSGWVQLCTMSVTDLEWFAVIGMSPTEELVDNLGRSDVSRPMHTPTVRSFPLRLFTDASGHSWGAVLEQDNKPIKGRNLALLTLEDIQSQTESHTKLSETQVVALGQWPVEEMSYIIAVKELKAVTMAISAFQDSISGTEVLLYIDNQTALAVIRSGSSRSPELQAAVRELWELCDQWNVRLYPRYIPTEWNKSDAPSRLTLTHNWRLRQPVVDEIWLCLGKPEIDLFASSSAHVLEQWVSLFHHPNNVATDAFSLNWAECGTIFVNPPWHLLPRIIHKWRVEGARGVLVAPEFPGCEWFQKLRRLAPTTEHWLELGKAFECVEYGDDCRDEEEAVDMVHRRHSQVVPQARRNHAWKLVAVALHPETWMQAAL